MRPSDGSVLALPSDDGWTVPNFVPENTDARVVEHINAEMRRQFGIDTWTLKHAARGVENGQAWRIYVAVVRGHGKLAIDGAEWLTQGAVSSTQFASAAVGYEIERWLASAGRVSPLRAAWEEIGWHDAACEWISTQLAAIGLTPISPIVQQRAWGLSCTMMVSTDAGDVYFKATPEFMAHEGRAMQAVAERCPELLPMPIAVDAESGWALMPDYGGKMLHECSDISIWEEALRVFGKAQVEQAAQPHIGFWQALNIPDRRIGRVVDMIDPLIAACGQMMSGGENGLADTEIDALRSLSMPLKLLCARLSQYPVPHTMVHGDLGGNILIQESGFTYFDWTDICISHPFFEMATISGAYFDESALKDSPDAEARLRNAYLEAWTEYMPMERLIEAFEKSRPLGALHQMMTYMWIRTNIPPDARPELDGGLLHWTRNLLRLCGRSQ